MDSVSSQQSRRAPGFAPTLLVGLSALLLYGLSLSPYPFPGDSATILAAHLRLGPFPPLTNPVWGFVVRTLSYVGGKEYGILFANLFGVVCGALTVAFLFGLLRLIPFRVSLRQPAAPAVSLSAAAAGTLVFVFFPVIWHVNSRAHPLSFNLLLLVGALLLLARYAQTRRIGWLYAGLLTSSIGAAEFSTMSAFAPILGLGALALMWRNGHFQTKRILAAALCSLAGIVPLLASAVEYYTLPSAVWREFPNLGMVAWIAMVERWRELSGGIPRVGWLVVASTTVLPMIVMMPLIYGRDAYDITVGKLVLVVAVLLSSAVLSLPTQATPWRIPGHGALIAAPIVAAAISVSMAVGLLALFLTQLQAPRHYTTRPKLWRVPPWLVAFLPVFLCMALGIALGSPLLLNRQARDAHELARVYAGVVKDRQVIVTDGVFDDLLLLETRYDLPRRQLISLPGIEWPAYKKYAASLMPTPRLKALALVNVGVALEDWFAFTPGVADRLVCQPSCDPWLSGGYEPYPWLCAYFGSPPQNAPTNDAQQAAGTLAFIAACGPILQQWDQKNHLLRSQAGAWRVRLSSLANNLGVYLENRGQDRDAVELYRAALYLLPRNVCAKLNLWILYRRLGADALAEAFQARAGEDLDRARFSTSPLQISSYGHVRNCEAVEWATQQMREEPPEPPPEVPELIQARELLATGEVQSARSALLKLVTRKEDHEIAWVLLARIAAWEGDARTLAQAQEKMKQSGRNWPELAALLGAQAVASGDLEQAREWLKSASSLWSSRPELLETLLLLDLQLDKEADASRHFSQLIALVPDSPALDIALGFLMLEQDEFELAESVLLQALNRRPAAIALYGLAQLHARQREWDKARPSLLQALALAPREALYWRLLAEVDLETGRLDGASWAIGKALEFQPDNTDGILLNAEVLARRGRKVEARACLRNLLSRRPDLTPEQKNKLKDLN